MAFCKYSSSLINSTTINIDAKFLNDYLGTAPENCLKVYLFGLLKCQNSAAFDNTIDNFENVLGLSKEDILSCFMYWEDQNVVQIINTDPVEVRYLPTKNNVKSIKKLEGKKYAAFVQQVQEIISGRQINPSEFYRYIDFLETNHLQSSDFCMIVKYCVDIKGDNINANYILTVARVWLDEGIRTAEQIEEKIQSLTLSTSDVNTIAKALKFKGNLSIEHRQYYEKWTKSFGFSLGNLVLIAKKVSSKTKNYSFEMLDKQLKKYYELHLFSFPEIEEYEANKADLVRLAREVNKTLGTYYDIVDNEIDTYILPWLSKGFNEQALLQIANFCFKSTIKTLDGMDSYIQKFYKLGLTSVTSIDRYFSEILHTDSKIKAILQKLNIDRRVNTYDRSFYKTWTENYKFSDEIIDYALQLSKAKMGGMRYANDLLTMWHDSKLTSIDEIKKQNKVVPVKTQNNFNHKSYGEQNFTQRTYTNEEINALYDNLDEIDI